MCQHFYKKFGFEYYKTKAKWKWQKLLDIIHTSTQFMSKKGNVIHYLFTLYKNLFTTTPSAIQYNQTSCFQLKTTRRKQKRTDVRNKKGHQKGNYKMVLPSSSIYSCLIKVIKIDLCLMAKVCFHFFFKKAMSSCTSDLQ